MVETVEVSNEQNLDEQAYETDKQRNDEESAPVADTEDVAKGVRTERTQHEENAVRKIDDTEQAEDNRQAQGQNGVESSVDEPQDHLCEKQVDVDIGH